RVRLPGVCGRNRCSWVACTGPYTTGHARPAPRAVPDPRAVHRVPARIPVCRMPPAFPRPEGLRHVAAAVAALFLLASIVGLQRLAVRGADTPLRYLGGEVKTLDPARISDAGDVQLLLQLYAGLTRLDEEGRVYPSLANSWDVTDGGRTYTFHLRPDLHFSDGSTLDASDVRRSWLRLLDPDVHATAP